MKNKNNLNKTKHDKHEINFGSLPIHIEEGSVKANEKHKELAHWHNEVELIRVKEGHMRCYVNDEAFLLDKGELCFINLHQMHRLNNVDEEDGIVETLQLDPRMLSQNKEVYEKYVEPVLDDRDFAHLRMDGRNGYTRIIFNLFSQIKKLAMEKEVGYELDVLSLVHMIFRRLYLLYSEVETKKVNNYNDIDLQKKMTSFIYENYGKKIKLEDIASAAGISRSKCASIFKKFTEKTPITFLNSYRLEMSCRMLTHTDDSLAEIAWDCGFQDQSYFNRLFMREFDMTPLQWRKKYK